MWSVREARVLWTAAIVSGASIRFSSDASRLVIEDETIAVVDAHSGRTIASLPREPSSGISGESAPTGLLKVLYADAGATRLISAGMQKIVVWDVDRATRIAQFDLLSADARRRQNDLAALRHGLPAPQLLQIGRRYLNACPP